MTWNFDEELGGTFALDVDLEERLRALDQSTEDADTLSDQRPREA